MSHADTRDPCQHKDIKITHTFFMNEHYIRNNWVYLKNVNMILMECSELL